MNKLLDPWPGIFQSKMLDYNAASCDTIVSEAMIMVLTIWPCIILAMLLVLISTVISIPVACILILILMQSYVL